MSFRFRPLVETLDGRWMPDGAPGDPPPTDDGAGAIVDDTPPPPAGDPGAEDPGSTEPPLPGGAETEDVSILLDEITRLEAEYTKLMADYQTSIESVKELNGAIAAADTAYQTAKIHLMVADTELMTARSNAMNAETVLCELDADPNTDTTSNTYISAVNALATATTQVAVAEAAKVAALTPLVDQLLDQKSVHEFDREMALCEAVKAHADAQAVHDRLVILKKAI